MRNRWRLMAAASLAACLFALPARSGQKLDLSLEVSNWTDVAREAEPVTSGIPLPAGAVYDLGRLQIVDAGGAVVPAQFRALDRWWYEKHTGVAQTPSVRWVLCDFPASVPPNGVAMFRLQTTDKPAAPKTPLKLTDAPGRITVVTGPLKFTVSKKAFRIFDGVWLDANKDGAFADGEQIVAAKGTSGGTVAAGDWADGGCKPGHPHNSGVTPPSSVEILENGPVRAVIRVEGRHHATVGGVAKGLYGYSCILTAWAGRPEVEVQYAITNTRVEEVGQNRYQMHAWPIESARLRFDLKADGLLAEIPDELAVAASTGRLGMALTMRDIRHNAPKELAADDNAIMLGLLPKGDTPYWISAKCRKNHRLLVAFFAGQATASRARTLWKRAEAPLRMLADDPAWYWTTQAWDGGLGPHPKHKRLAPAQRTRWDKSKARYTGWTRYGYLGEFNGAGSHWNFKSVFWPYVCNGSRHHFEYAESRALYFNDFVPVHTPRDRWQVLKFTVTPEEHRATSNYARSHTRVSVKSFPGYKVHGPNTPDTGHMANFQLTEYYRLTGDWATLDSIESEGFRAAQNVYKRTYGSYGAWKTRKGKADLDQVAIITYGARYVGWPIFVATQAYQATGNERYLYPARLYARGLGNIGRNSPVGFISPTYYQKNDGGYGRSYIANWKKKYPGRPVPASQSTAPFQIGIGMRGLFKFWEETHDPHVRDALILSGKCMEQIAARKDGKYLGWQYVWTDYWTEGRPYASGVFTSSAGEIPGSVGFSYLVSGRPEFLQVCRDAAPIHNRTGDDRTFGIYMSLWQSKQRDPTPPATVADLKANAPGGGKVELTWTAPGDDGTTGRAAEYSVRRATAPIVDCVSFWNPKTKTGWPDLNDPLPTTPAAWAKKARAFMATQQISFWAAPDLPAPKPAEPGHKETLTVEGLKPGTHYFAVVAWDEAPNCSKISNVASVEVK